MEEIKIVFDDTHQQPVVSSLQIANDFEKNHRDVLKAIENLKEGVAQNFADLFYKTTYVHEQNKQEYPMYLMNRDGFTLLCMGFNGTKAIEWKLKYIKAFNDMEQQLKEQTKLPTNPKDILKLIVQANEETDKKVEELREDINSKFKEMPLFNSECDELEKTVRKVGTRVLGGYHSPAYSDASLRQKVYSDIHRQVKREFGVSSYKSIKREYHDGAIKIINEYSAPVVIRDEINRVNNQQTMDFEGGTSK